MMNMSDLDFEKLIRSGGPIPQEVTIEGSLDFAGQPEDLPLLSMLSLTVNGYAEFDGCIALDTLPKYLDVRGYLSLSQCTSLSTLPDTLHVEGSLYLDDCISLRSLPRDLQVGRHLLLGGCTSLLVDEYGFGQVDGQVLVDEAFFDRNSDHLLSLISYQWYGKDIEDMYKSHLQNCS